MVLYVTRPRRDEVRIREECRVAKDLNFDHVTEEHHVLCGTLMCVSILCTTCNLDFLTNVYKCKVVDIFVHIAGSAVQLVSVAQTIYWYQSRLPGSTCTFELPTNSSIVWRFICRRVS